MNNIYNKYIYSFLLLSFILITVKSLGQETIKKTNPVFSTKLTAQVKYIHFGSTSDPINGLTITWRSKGDKDSIRWGYTNTYEKGKYLGVKRDAYEDYFFDYKFPALNANDTIHYIIYDSYNSSWTQEKTYITADAVNSTKFSFLAMGDSRSYVEDWRNISSAANTNQTDFTLFTGDIVSVGGDTEDWNEWFEYGEDFLSENLVYHSIGNHECRSDGAPVYANNFCLPENPAGTEYYYSFTYGNAVFICLDTEEDETPTEGSVQYSWLKEVLQANQDKTWKIVWFHCPFYTTGEHAGEMDSKMDTWFDAFDTYGVDMIFNGHDHMYERTKPVQKNGKVVDEYGSATNQGRCQIVCGGAGAPLYSPGTADWLETAAKKYHYCKIQINGDTLKFEAYDNSNILFDELTIVKKATSISKQALNEHVEIYPNPTNNQVIIKGENLKISEIKFYNASGQDFSQSVKLSQSSNTIVVADLSKLPQGVYFVKVQKKTYKVFKN